MTFGYEELEYALEESVKLQSHYAKLLNIYDGGQRLEFNNSKEWLIRLRKIIDNKRNKISEKRTTICDNCGGSGIIHSHNDICDMCDGKGWLKI